MKDGGYHGPSDGSVCLDDVFLNLLWARVGKLSLTNALQVFKSINQFCRPDLNVFDNIKVFFQVM